MMDNRVFNVNGESKEMLALTLELAFQQWSDRATAEGWLIDKSKGLILLWCVNDRDKEVNRLPAELTAAQCLDFVWAWLKSPAAKTIECVGWDADSDHDGHNDVGWRVYCEDWGHVADKHNALIAIKPAFMWYGK